MPRPDAFPEFETLRSHGKELRQSSLLDLVNASRRLETMQLEAEGIFVDMSKALLDERALELLLALARKQGLAEGIRAMCEGQPINNTEKRAALHVALRNKSERPIFVEGRDVMPEVRAELSKIEALARAVRSGSWRGHTGERITDVVNIGIGGSDLGPRLICEALEPYWNCPPSPLVRPHFVSNVDGADLGRLLKGLRPESTLFLISSKTFTTPETIANAKSARAWLCSKLGEEAVARHFFAISTNEREVARFGIDPSRMLRFWEWVGGRFSLWSAIGTIVAIAIGPERFFELLEGAFVMDEHFRTAPLEHNLPVRLGLLDFWYSTVLGAESLALIPYSQLLASLPSWFQQCAMESNGKGVDRDGFPLSYPSASIIWGAPGTNSQHAFFQLLHQGTRFVPCEFVAAIEPSYEFEGALHHVMLLANMIAQSEALLLGKDLESVRQELMKEGRSAEEIEALAPHKVFPGKRPSTVILMERIDPRHLGALLALYEHRVFVQGWMLGINSFDQWGVELGKRLAQTIVEELKGAAPSSAHDPSTQALIARLRNKLKDLLQAKSGE
ncbi:MAG: glucose-6-phosphate isomerase [Deltaproteobacteria bacterium]|nr:glucose-6-phosphate isomerase [Deltaproteobacteria bacterium]